MTKRQDFCRDVLITAIEGGINYWSVTLSYDPEEGQATVSPIDSNAIYAVTLQLIETGIDRILGEQVSVPIRVQAEIEEAWADYDAGMIDADAADLIVQVGLFQAVVYG